MIHVVRHGRTASNAGGLLLGRADPPLDDVGVAQAARAAAALAGGPWPPVGRIVTSPLQRTRATAAAIAEATGAVVEVDDRFVELDYGEWDERPIGEVSAAEWAAWRSDVDFAPPGGESLAELGRRVRAGLDDIVARHAAGSRGSGAGTSTVVVSHVSPIKAAVAWALGVGDELAWRMFVAPASITRIAVSGPAPSLHAFNDTAHLTPA